MFERLTDVILAEEDANLQIVYIIADDKMTAWLRYYCNKFWFIDDMVQILMAVYYSNYIVFSSSLYF